METHGGHPGLFGMSRALIHHAQAVVDAHDTGQQRTAGRVRQVIGGMLVSEGIFGMANPDDGRKTRGDLGGAAKTMVFGVLGGGYAIWGLSGGTQGWIGPWRSGWAPSSCSWASPWRCCARRRCGSAPSSC